MDNYYLLIIDTVGCSNGTSTDKKLFSLCCLISSTIIYNDSSSKDSFNSFNSLISHIKTIKIKKNKAVTKDYLPQLIYLLRDNEKNPVSNESNDNLMNQNNVNDLFNNVRHFSFPKPVADGNGDIDLNASKDFTEAFNKFRTYLLSSIQNKRIGLVNLNGNILYGILQNYSDSLNISESPIILESLECVLLSKIKEISEKTRANCKVRLIDIKKTLSRSSANIFEEYKSAFNILIDESIPSFFRNCDVGMSIPQKKIAEYVNQLVITVKEETEKSFLQSVSSYDQLINSFITKHIPNKQVTLDNIIDYIKNVSIELNNQMITIASFIPFAVTNKRLEYIKICFGGRMKEMEDNVSKLVQNINIKNKELNDYISEQKSLLTDENRKILQKSGEILELRSSIEKLTRDLKTKDKEYSITLNNEKEKSAKSEERWRILLTKKENDIASMKVENETLNNELRLALKEKVSKENEVRKLGIELEAYKSQDVKARYSVNDFNTANIKAIFQTIQAVLIEYKHSVDILDKEKDNLFHSNSIEYGFKETETKTKALLNELQELKEYYEKNINQSKEELDNLKFELEKTRYALKEEQDINASLQFKIEESKKDIHESIEMSTKKDSIIQSQNQTIDDYVKQLKTAINNTEELEKNLNNSIVLYKMKEDEIEILLLVFFNVLNKKKEQYERNFKKLSDEIKTKVDSYVKNFKIFK